MSALTLKKSSTKATFHTKYFLITLIAFISLSYITEVFAINASPHPINATQPDGTKIVLKIKGDEHFHWQEDNNGYTVLKEKGRYVYAQRGASGHLIPTELEVGQSNPKANGLQKRILPSQSIINQQKASAPGSTSESSASTPEQVPPSGTIKNLVVMIRFSDHEFRTLPSATDIDVLFNADTPDPALAPTGSVKAVYLENSYGQMTLNSTISGWIDVSGTEAYYADGQSGSSTLWGALQEALNKLETEHGLNFNEYDQDNDGYIDSISFIHSGYGAEWGGTDTDGANTADRIWSHRWAIQPSWVSTSGIKVFDYHISPSLWGTSGSAIGRIGVIAHETGHFFGLPDLYDTNGGGQGIGSYGLMANSWGFDNSQHYPPHFSPWSKINLGWVSPTVISAPGTYSLQQAEDTAAVYRIDHGYPNGEYLLIENRQPIGFDAAMTQGGLTIWHIDDNAGYNTQGFPGQVPPWPTNGAHYRVALLQADGEYDLEWGRNRGDADDVWHAAGVDEINGTTLPSTDTYQGGTINPTGNRLYNISTASSSMSFDYDNGLSPIDPPTAPTLTPATYDGVSDVTLQWSDNSDNEDGFNIFRNGSEIANVSANNVTYTDTGVADGVHEYYVQAFNAGGLANSNAINVDVVLPPIRYASGEATTFGSMTGSYLNTFSINDSETLTEVESGGKPSKRTSRLEHIWQFDNIGSGIVTTLAVNAAAPANSEGDNFAFSYSVDGGQNYTPIFELAAGADQILLGELSSVVDSVLVKVEDTDPTRGNRNLDSISIRQISIDWTDDVTFTAPTTLSATAISDTQIDLSWTDGSGESGYTVLDASGTTINSGIASNSTSTSITGLLAETKYSYEVCGIDPSSALICSNQDSATTLATPIAGAPTLDSASGSKVKGRQQVDLTWSYDGAVDIYRTGTSSAKIDNQTGSYLDLIGTKGGATYIYQVCPAGSLTGCSNTLTVVF